MLQDIKKIQPVSNTERKKLCKTTCCQVFQDRKIKPTQMSLKKEVNIRPEGPSMTSTEPSKDSIPMDNCEVRNISNIVASIEKSKVAGGHC